MTVLYTWVHENRAIENVYTFYIAVNSDNKGQMIHACMHGIHVLQKLYIELSIIP